MTGVKNWYKVDSIEIAHLCVKSRFMAGCATGILVWVWPMQSRSGIKSAADQTPLVPIAHPQIHPSPPHTYTHAHAHTPHLTHTPDSHSRPPMMHTRPLPPSCGRFSSPFHPFKPVLVWCLFTPTRLPPFCPASSQLGNPSCLRASFAKNLSSFIQLVRSMNL